MSVISKGLSASFRSCIFLTITGTCLHRRMFWCGLTIQRLLFLGRTHQREVSLSRNAQRGPHLQSQNLRTSQKGQNTVKK